MTQGFTTNAGTNTAPNTATFILKTANAQLSNAQVLGDLSTGLLKNTTTTGVLSTAVEGTDYYKPGGTDVVVADGGLGVSTLTAYAPIFGGTTNTGPVQSGTVGTAGQVLTSNGAGALPTFQSPSGVPSGTLLAWPTHIAPSGYLLSYGQAISRATYANIFANIVPTIGTFTVTSASPAVVTLTAHGLSIGDSFYATTTGVLPTGMPANTLFYIISTGFTANSFRFSTTYGGAAVNTTDPQSGTHTLSYCPWGLGDGSTTFNTPDSRGRGFIGKDNLGGTAAGRIVATQGSNIGQNGGTENHTLTTAQMPSHTHVVNIRTITAPGIGSNAICGHTNTADGTIATAIVAEGGGGSHNNLAPYSTVGWIIKI